MGRHIRSIGCKLKFYLLFGVHCFYLFVVALVLRLIDAALGERDSKNEAVHDEDDGRGGGLLAFACCLDLDRDRRGRGERPLMQILENRKRFFVNTNSYVRVDLKFPDFCGR